MRIVRKINLALAGVVGFSALLNFAALELTVMPSFVELETQAAERNQSRVAEAMRVQQDQVAHAVRDYAFWDDSYEFFQGKRPDYVEKNINEASLKALGINYFAAVDSAGAVKLDLGFQYTPDGATPIMLLGAGQVAADNPLGQPFGAPDARSGLVRTEDGIAVVAAAPVLTSEQTGESPGNLIFGKILDLDELRNATKVDFELVPVSDALPVQEGIERGPETVKVRTVLPGVDGKPLLTLVSETDRSISAAGKQAILAAMGLLLVAGLALIGTLAFALRRIAVRRIERMRDHLLNVGSSGTLEPLEGDKHGDELSETIDSFNHMAAQLSDLRERLQKQDYRHGAADQAAGILHNVRNAVSPIGTIAWDLARAEDAPWKQNLAKALQQLKEGAPDPEHVRKLQEFVSLSAGKLLSESASRRADLQSLNAMVRHVDSILKEQDDASHGARVVEPIDLKELLTDAARAIGKRPGISVAIETPAEARVLGHKIALQQALTNVLVNAAEAIEATGRGSGTVRISVDSVAHRGSKALDIRIADDGEGIGPGLHEKVFENGYSTRRQRSGGLGLHWSANAINAMGGRIFAESDGPGQGAVLHLVIPCSNADLQDAA